MRNNYSKVFRLFNSLLFFYLILIFTFSTVTIAQEQSRESMAVDATAAQWSYQFAWEGFFDYKTDTLDNGEVRQEGRKGFFQFRWVAPIPKSEKMPITLLPRLTLRIQQNSENEFGLGSSDIFVLGMATL